MKQLPLLRNTIMPRMVGIEKALADKGIVSAEFTEKKLIPMFDYRNRVVHFYA